MEAVISKYGAENEIFLTTGEISCICNESNYLPNNYGDVYFFISVLLDRNIIQRVQRGKYVLETKNLKGFK